MQVSRHQRPEKIIETQENCVQDGVEDESVTSTEAFRDEVEEPADNDEILSERCTARIDYLGKHLQ